MESKVGNKSKIKKQDDKKGELKNFEMNKNSKKLYLYQGFFLLNLSKSILDADEAAVVLAELPSAGEVAAVSVASGIATLDFTTAVSASDIIRVYVKLAL